MALAIFRETPSRANISMMFILSKQQLCYDLRSLCQLESCLTLGYPRDSVIPCVTRTSLWDPISWLGVTRSNLHDSVIPVWLSYLYVTWLSCMTWLSMCDSDLYPCVTWLSPCVAGVWGIPVLEKPPDLSVCLWRGGGGEGIIKLWPGIWLQDH